MKEKLIDVSFKITSYRHNKDLFYENDSIISSSDGVILQLRVDNNKKPKQIGEYSIDNINLELGRVLSIDINELLDNYIENKYKELKDEIKYNNFDISNYNRIIIVSSVVISKEFRGYNILNELSEMLYRDYYGHKTLILFHALPFQYNSIDESFYREDRIIKDSNNVGILAFEYYDLDVFYGSDAELSYYKLYTKIQQCGFNRIGESNLFWFDPTITIKQIKEKQYENEN